LTGDAVQPQIRSLRQPHPPFIELKPVNVVLQFDKRGPTRPNSVGEEVRLPVGTTDSSFKGLGGWREQNPPTFQQSSKKTKTKKKSVSHVTTVITVVMPQQPAPNGAVDATM
jgi:hypothetical protein